MAVRLVTILSAWAFIILLICGSQRSSGQTFQPVSPQELQMTSEPLAPGVPAIILYREVQRFDASKAGHENNYFRIKILTEEGRKHADVEIPFYKEYGYNVVNIHARTIQPDGSIVNFDGKVYEKLIAKARGLNYVVKTFILPEVHVGSIIEYYYTVDLADYYLFDSHWILSDELFTKSAKFSLTPYKGSQWPINVRWEWQGLPPGTDPPKQGPDNIIRMEANNIPAFQTEDYMPPENELKARVDFHYSYDAFENDTDQFWKNYGKRLNASIESFVGKPKAMQQAVAQIVSPSDSAEVKLQKIYARVQELRNTSYESRKTEQERKRAKEKEVSNVEEVWKRGYGDGAELTWLFLGLARAANFEVYPVMVSDRRNYFFHPTSMDPNRLDASVVLVKLNGREIYCDPGAAFTPFGMLEWPETGVQGLRLDKDGGSWVRTSLPESAQSRVERRAALSLSENGDIEGHLTVTFTGLEAMRRRVEERNEDEAQRKKFLEDEVSNYIPAASQIELTNQPDWSHSYPPLIAEFKVTIPGWASGAGRRVLFPVGVFSATERHVFDHAQRIHPIYFEFPCEKLDDVSIALPPGWQIGTLPAEQVQDRKLVLYKSKAENDKGALHLNRELKLDVLLLDPKYYPDLRNFFQSLRAGDEQQIVLQPIGASAKK